jgi:hypothetical protein
MARVEVNTGISRAVDGQSFHTRVPVGMPPGSGVFRYSTISFAFVPARNYIGMMLGRLL